MPKRSSPKRDFIEVARGVVEQAIGEQMDGNPLPDPPKDERNPHAVALGSMGGKKGGKARANKLTATRDHAAALAIWFMYYNFCGIHQTLRVAPAMEAGLSDRLEHKRTLRLAAKGHLSGNQHRQGDHPKGGGTLRFPKMKYFCNIT
jgi:hypothetical protein